MTNKKAEMKKPVRYRAIIRALSAAATAAVLLLGAPAALGQSVPETTVLLEVQMPGQYPQKVAADTAGNIYVTDPVKKMLKAYNRRGQSIWSAWLTKMPFSVAAVSPDKVYVGMRGEIILYGRNGVKKGSIGPLGLAVDMAALSDGTLYVLDANDGNVKVFGPGGAMLSSFGSKGTGDGQFKGSKAIAVDEASGLLYVLDKGHSIPDPYNSYYTILVERIQVFDLSGGFLRKFANFGYKSVGKVANASGMAADDAGRIYISDGMQNVIVVYDSYGTYLKTIVDTADPFFFPIGLDFKAGRLYAACYVGKNVKVVGVDGYTDLEVLPDSLSFMAQSGLSTPQKEISLSNGGPGDMVWNASASEGWIIISETTGTVAGNSAGALGVTVSAEGKSVGTYTGSVEISTPGAVEHVSVTMEVVPPPTLSADPVNLAFQAKREEPAPTVFVNIELANDMSDSLSWSAVSDSGWLRISPASGSSNALTAANLLVTHDGLAPGIYTSKVTVTASADFVVGSPLTINVELEVLPADGRIMVNTNLADATFEITGPVSYSGTGTELLIKKVPPGEYTITFGPVGGYRTPEGATATVAPGVTVYFSGEYERLANIVAAKGPGPENDTLVRIFDPFGVFTGVEFEAFPGESYGVNIATGDIDGDGVDEIIVGQSGRNAPARVKVFSADGTPVGGADFVAFLSRAGVKVGAGDVDGDGVDEIIALLNDGGRTPAQRAGAKGYPPAVNGRTSSGSPPQTAVTTAQMRVFKYVSGEIRDTGVNAILATGSELRHSDVQTGDVDGDGVAEIGFTMSASSGIGRSENIYVRFLDVDTTGGLGAWSVSDSGVSISAGVKSSLALGDVDGDGVAEIILGASVLSNSAGTREFIGVIDVLRADGTKIESFRPVDDRYGYELSSGLSITDDAGADIAVGLGPGPESPSVVIVYDGAGNEVMSFEAFEGSFYGARVAFGDFGY